jgi:hypothetical protein
LVRALNLGDASIPARMGNLMSGFQLTQVRTIALKSTQYLEVTSINPVKKECPFLTKYIISTCEKVSMNSKKQINIALTFSTTSITSAD